MPVLLTKSQRTTWLFATITRAYHLTRIAWCKVVEDNQTWRDRSAVGGITVAPPHLAHAEACGQPGEWIRADGPDAYDVVGGGRTAHPGRGRLTPRNRAHQPSATPVAKSRKPPSPIRPLTSVASS